MGRITPLAKCAVALVNDLRVYGYRKTGRKARHLSASRSPVSLLTQILGGLKDDDPRAAEQLLPLVYDELRKLRGHGSRRTRRGRRWCGRP